MADDGQIVGLTEPDSDAEKISEIIKTRMELSNSTIYRETARRPARFYALRAASGAARSLRPQARFGAQPPHSGGS